jgi:hypothetical protein
MSQLNNTLLRYDEGKRQETNSTRVWGVTREKESSTPMKNCGYLSVPNSISALPRVLVFFPFSWTEVPPQHWSSGLDIWTMKVKYKSMRWSISS